MKTGSWGVVPGVLDTFLRKNVVRGLGLVLLGAGLAPVAHAETDFSALFPPPPPRVDQTPLPKEVLDDQTFAFVGEEHHKLIDQARNLAALGPDLFGDQTNLQTGSTEFIHTDIDLPGNNGLPVRLQRRFTAASKRGLTLVRQAAFADWELEVPYLSGEFAAEIGWRVDIGGLSGGQSSDQRCSITAPERTVPPSIEVPGFPQPELFRPLEYWHGYNLHLPGGGGGELLWLSPTNTTQKPTDGPSYYWATNGIWFFSCANGPVGVGEIFIGRAPDGLRYTFGHLVNRQASRLSANGSTAKLLRTEVRLVATRVEDRFGNWVAYNWSGSQLASITASDGRSITFTYNPTTGYVTTASDGTRTWSYAYTGTGTIIGGSRTGAPSLSRVIRPDTSTWAINFASLAQANVASERNTANCFGSGEPISPDFTGTLTHPSGATGTFTFGPVQHGRTRVPRFCVNEDELGNVGDDYSWFTLTFDVLALKTKRIVGGALPTLQWDYSYASNFCFASGDGACTASTPDFSTTTVVQLGAGVDRYRFGNVYRGNEGKLLKVEHGSSVTVNGTLQGVIGSEESQYQLDGSNQVYPSPIAVSPQPRGDAFTAENFLPLRQKIIIQDGANFIWEAQAFDQYAQPIQVKRSSSLGFNKIELTSYRNDTNLWLIGQTESVKDQESALVEQLNEFFPNGQVSASFAFGDLQSSFQYYPDGSVRSITDGRGNATTLSDYFRGVPQSVQYADGASQSAIVSPIGNISQITDAMGFSSNFGYDAMGRLNRIDYPTGDSTVWNATTRSFAPVASIEFGIPAGHWKLIEQTGTGRTSTFYDAFWRPVLTLTEDSSDPATRSYVVNRYDAKGRLAFTSFPVASLATINDSLLGTSTQYDLLGRPTEIRQDSELGPLLTRSAYLPGFQTQVTDPRGQVTTTDFQAFDTPSTETPMRIVLPDGSTTTFTRDDFGKPLSVTRSSNGG